MLQHLKDHAARVCMAPERVSVTLIGHHYLERLIIRDLMALVGMRGPTVQQRAAFSAAEDSRDERNRSLQPSSRCTRRNMGAIVDVS